MLKAVRGNDIHWFVEELLALTSSKIADGSEAVAKVCGFLLCGVLAYLIINKLCNKAKL